MGFASYGLKEGWNRRGPAASAFMERLLGHMGVDQELIPDWHEHLTHTWEKSYDPYIPAKKGNFMIPPATLFLGMNRNYIPEKGSQFGAQRITDGVRKPDEVKALVEADPELESLKQRVMDETGALRVWLHMHYRIFKGGEIPDSGAPWVKMMTRPVNEITYKYHFSIAPLDAVWKE